MVRTARHPKTSNALSVLAYTYTRAKNGACMRVIRYV